MASNETSLLAEVQSNDKVMELARKRGYHGMFNTPDDLNTAYNLLCDTIDMLPQGYKQGVAVQFQCFINTMACATAINDNSLYTMIEEGRLEDAQAHVARLRGEIEKAEETDGSK